MVKLDIRDRKILHQLDINSRQSASQIGKKIGLNRDVVTYRIKKLQNEGIIINYYTVIDASKLGYISFRFYFVFQYTTPEIQKEITDYFINNKYTYFVGPIEGIYDLLVIMWVKNVTDFYSFYEETKKKYGYYFKEINFALYVQLLHYRASFLIDTPDERTNPMITGGQKPLEVDDIDIQLLKIIAGNARLPTIEIAREMNTTTTVVSHRIKKMIKKGVIQGFKTNLDYMQLGFQDFKVDIHLKEYSDIRDVTKYLVKNPHLYYINKTAGHADLEIEFYVKTINHVHQIMMDLVTKFPGKIKFYNTYNILDFIKRQFMPEE
jgi:Lrp/AsnC family transcriptional regulator for asnA, asnC and gidA